jgi:site-specific recombinase XerD
VRLIAETLYMTGARVSKILGIRRDSVHVNGSVELSLYGKGGKERSARIPRAFYDRILGEYPEGTFLFSTRTGAAFAREYVSREIARASKRVPGRAVSAK